MELPQPMTVARAKLIDPNLTTGIALSTTHVFGDCRPVDLEETPADRCASARPGCASERAPLLVLIVPVNQSIPRSDVCASKVTVEDLAARAIANTRADNLGELVLAIPSGRYLAYLSRDDRCAACGVESAGEGCLLDVVSGEVTARDLVLDRSSR